VHFILVQFLTFALGSASLLNLVGLGYALLLNREFKGKGAARLMVYIPAVISPLIMGYVWYFFLQPGRGYLARALFLIGKDGFINTWMDQYWSVMMVLILVNVWQYAGMTMVIYLAGLQAIPGELYESAVIDGAGAWKSFRHITLPLLRPSIQINVVTNIIGSLSVFDIVMSLTEGGPGYTTETLSIYIMRMCYGNRTGYSTAVAVIMFFIILIPVLISWQLTAVKEEGMR
jgi:raffinose/stachyose/melibiose transport system permease protein